MIEYYPDKQVDGIRGWHWITTDNGAWDGPKVDWETSHKPIIEKLVTRKKVVVQAGGCQGMYPKLLARMFESVYTFEPDHESFRALVLNCEEENVHKVQAGLGSDHRGISVRKTNPRNVGTNTTVVGGTVLQVRIDDFELAPDLIWLDIEGGETEAIRGALKTIEAHGPVVMCENPREPLVKILRDTGYEMIDKSVSDGVFVRRRT